MGERIRVPVERLEVGMQVVLPASWLHHPFVRSAFRIDSEAQIRKIREAGFSWVFVEHASEEPPMAGSAAELTAIAQRIVEVLEDDRLTAPERAERVYGLAAAVVSSVFEDPSPAHILVASAVAKSLAEAVANDEAVAGSLAAVSSFDRKTYEHSVRVGCLSICLATRWVGPSRSEEVTRAAPGFLLHDIGKVALPWDLLNKAGPLSDQEREIMRRHTTEGFRILSAQEELDPVCARIALQHHERSDGSGYPLGLRQDEIEPFARVCSVADVFDALTTHRPYRVPLRPYEALELMRREMLAHFQRDVLTEFVLLLGERRVA